jgi:hypothetical protein
MTRGFSDFYTKGFQVFDGSKYSQCLDVSDVIWVNDGNKKDRVPSNNVEYIERMMYALHHELGLDIISPIVKNYTVEKRGIWEGVNSEMSRSWHNDHAEGFNCFFLLYHSDMVDDGRVYFRNSTEEWSILPSSGTLVAINNTDIKFQHRAEPSKKQRIVSSYFFNLDF